MKKIVLITAVLVLTACSNYREDPQVFDDPYNCQSESAPIVAMLKKAKTQHAKQQLRQLYYDFMGECEYISENRDTLPYGVESQKRLRMRNIKSNAAVVYIQDKERVK